MEVCNLLRTICQYSVNQYLGDFEARLLVHVLAENQTLQTIRLEGNAS